MPVEKSGSGGARASSAKPAASGKAASPRRRRAAAKPAKAARSASVIMQARVEEGFARTLVEQDAVVLGLDGPSELVREGLRLVHVRAREAAMAAAYDDFYAGEPAPLPAGVSPADRD